MRELGSLLQQNLNRVRRPGYLSTIRARLSLAFGFIAALTLVGVVTAIYEFRTIETATTKIINYSFPATIVSLQLAEEASSLVSSAPRLINASEDNIRSEVEKHIDEQEHKLERQTKVLRDLGISDLNEIDTARVQLIKRLDALNDAVKQRIMISNERNHNSQLIQKAHENLLNAFAPAIDDANFDLMMMSKNSAVNADLGARLESLRRLLEAQSETNLLAGLLTEASLVNDVSRLEPLHDLIDAAKRKIEGNLQQMEDLNQKKKLSALYKQLSTIGSDHGIIQLRSSELKRGREAELAFTAAQSEAVKLKQAVDLLVDQQSKLARINELNAARRIRTGQIELIILACIALAGAGLIAWLYVGRSIIRRLGLLSNAMRRVADGDFTVCISDDRHDEIADMARTLLFFRQATVDATVARQKEIEQTESLEERRRLVEAATQNFEQAVSNVVGTLEHAAKAMDEAAGDMAGTASRNQQQAIAAAAATEQATSNVEIVAAAADELAHSIEHIATRSAESTTVASQAASEAEAISGAVDSLSKSVGEIGKVSDFISNIAAQTNLLALNATIEAARAGEAGRGFVVVAQEVKALASRTRKATEEITRQIKSIEETTSRSAEAIKTITVTIVKLNALAGDVATAVRQQESVTQEIAKNADATAAGTRNVSANVHEVSAAAVMTGQVANSVLRAAGELANQSSLLRSEVERFLLQVRVA